MRNERHNKILELLEKNGFVTLQELIEKLGVSEATVRRDLTLLEEKNLLYRTHGGASKKTSARGLEESVIIKRSENIKDKKEVARYIANNIIESGQTIYLDAGTSTFEIIDFLRDKRITVVTNSSYHLARLIHNKIHTIILGGTIKHSTQAVIGHSAIKQLENYSFDMCFVGCNGVDAKFGLTTAEESEAFIKQIALKNSKRKFILADKTKFGHRKFQKFADLKDVTIISYSVPEEFKIYDNIIEVKTKEDK
ncbi:MULTISPECIES: DeoR/GlpR family DNA-binding transcription regulator [Gemella]|uniref:DeoR/GlpR family DNA-binding transcription regulator n=1 Tax=Gemella TaxID=1378 RepID=UPI000768049A|nr:MULTISPECIES: DeoR/GlpR family DNA-binding transcription regulator [Gemella]AME08850.1 DeoR family transcriptional regulator [Gemella sp. oral taxon 928]AXI26419.1 DeoR/GlpR transcriptional regulator [Gemella sp. ND 6198]